jgi:hypothetical protein
MTTDTDFDDMYGSKYFSVTDLHGEEPRYKIGKVEVVDLKDRDTGFSKKKFAMYFSGIDKPLILNRTNAEKLAQSFGKDRGNWVGKMIELYSEMTSLGKAGVRLRTVKPVKLAADLSKVNIVPDDEHDPT